MDFGKINSCKKKLLSLKYFNLQVLCNPLSKLTYYRFFQISVLFYNVKFYFTANIQNKYRFKPLFNQL